MSEFIYFQDRKIPRFEENRCESVLFKWRVLERRRQSFNHNFELRVDEIANFELRIDEIANFELRVDEIANFELRIDEITNFELRR